MKNLNAERWDEPRSSQIECQGWNRDFPMGNNRANGLAVLVRKQNLSFACSTIFSPLRRNPMDDGHGTLYVNLEA